MLCICSNKQKMHEFIREARRLSAGIWKLKVEAVRSTAIPFLDLEVFVVRSTSASPTLAWRPYSKPTKAFIPLNADSAHPRKVHIWPVAEVSRLARNSSSASIFREAHLRFVRDLIDTGINGYIIARVINLHDSWRLLCKSKAGVKDSGSTLTCVLSFHPVLAFAKLAEVFDFIVCSFGLEIKWLYGALTTRVAWKISEPSLALRLRKI